MNISSNVFTTEFERQHCNTMHNGNITNSIRTKQIIIAWKQKQCKVRLLPTRCKLADIFAMFVTKTTESYASDSLTLNSR